MTYSGLIIVSRVIASCFTDRLGSNEYTYARYYFIRLLKRLASIFHFNIYTDDFIGLHPIIDYRVIDLTPMIVSAGFRCKTIICNVGIPMIITTIFIWMANKATQCLKPEQNRHSSKFSN